MNFSGLNVVVHILSMLAAPKVMPLTAHTRNTMTLLDRANSKLQNAVFPTVSPALAVPFHQQ